VHYSGGVNESHHARNPKYFIDESDLTGGLDGVNQGASSTEPVSPFISDFIIGFRVVLVTD
jgi:hypothetical protein